MRNKVQIVENIILSNKEYFENLGKSYDSAFQEKRRYLLVGEAEQETASASTIMDSFSYKFAFNQQEFSSLIKSSISAKASYGIFSGKASSSMNKFFSSNNYSCYIYGFMRLVNPRFVFDLRKTTLEPHIANYIANNQDNIDLIEKNIGDEVVTGVTISSEIMIKIEIKTSSENQKEEIKKSIGASAGTFGSGNAEFSSLYSKIKKGKEISIDIYGNIPNQFMSNVSASEVDKLLLEFPSRSEGNFSIMEFSMTPISEIPQLLEFNEIVNLNELEERKKFLEALNLIYQNHLNWKNDILYVTSASNKTEFAQNTINKAIKDLSTCSQNISQLEEIYSSASNYWRNNGENGNSFKISLLNEYPASFESYPRKKTVPPKPKPKPAPKPKPKPKPKPAERNDGPENNADSRY